MQYFRLSFDDNDDGIYETDITFTVNPDGYKCFAAKSRVVSIPLLSGSAIQDSGLFFEGSIIELSNVYITKSNFETLYRKYNGFIIDKQTAIAASNEYTLQDSNSALEKPKCWKGANVTDFTSLTKIDDDDVTFDLDTPTKVTLTSGLASPNVVYFLYRIERKNLILTDNNNEQWLVAWENCDFTSAVAPLETYTWNFRFTVIQKLYGTSGNVT